MNRLDTTRLDDEICLMKDRIAFTNLALCGEYWAKCELDRRVTHAHTLWAEDVDLTVMVESGLTFRHEPHAAFVVAKVPYGILNVPRGVAW